MATEIVMPRQGQSVEACTIVRWLKQPGENVGTGDVLCEIETDKAAFEVESTAAGTLLAQFVPEGEEVPVLTPIAAVGEPGEEVPAPAAAGAGGGALPPAPAGRPPAAHPAAAPEPEAAALPGQAPAVPAPADAHSAPRRGGPASSPRARRRAGDLGVDYSALSGSGPGGRIIERDVVAAAAARPALTAAARAAAAGGSPVPAAGSGIGGRVTLADMEAAAVPQAEAAPAAAAPDAAAQQVTTVPVTGVRKLISERMRQSLLDSAQLTMHASADAEALVAYRARLKNSAEHLQLRHVTINDLILFAAARTLPQFPELNAVVRSDGAGDHVERHRAVRLAFAVDTERGLMVPVIAAAERLSIAALAGRAHELAAAAQAGSISPDLLQGGTFTVTNLGALGVESFTPILNLPQVAILGVGALVLKPAAADLAQPGALRQVSYRRHLGLSLTIDHRMVDGAPAARFLQALAAAIADLDLLAAR